MGDLMDASIKRGNAAVLLPPVLKKIDPLKNVVNTFGS